MKSTYIISLLVLGLTLTACQSLIDHVIPYAMGKEVFEAIHCEKSFVSIEGAGHNNLHRAYAQQYWGAVLTFLKQRWV